MSKLGISTGTIPNDGLGDSLVAGAVKINSNFTEVYSAIGDGSNINIGVGKTIITTTLTGNVGIGSTIPTSRLDILGNTKVSGVVTATTFSGQVNAGVSTATSLNVSGVVTATTFSGQVNAGVSTATSLNVSGIVTANSFRGNIVGTSATFTGNVSIAGTLTYEDVTNVDSIGLVTARSGIRINSGGLVVTSGVSTFAGITTVTGDTLFSKQLNVSGVSTFAGITTVTGDTLFSKQLNVSGVSTFAGITTVTGDTLFSKQLNVSGVSTYNNTAVFIPTSTEISGIFSGTTSNDMVRITQLGTGNALVVEDSTNPDASPFVVGAAGSVGIGTSNPTAILHLRSGSSSANNSPLKFSAGPVLTSSEVGSVEYDGTTFYATPNAHYGRSTIPTTVYTSGIGSTGITGSTNHTLFPATNDTLLVPVGTHFVRTAFRISVTGSVVSAACTFNIRGAGTAVGSFSWRGTAATSDGVAPSSFAIAATPLSATPVFAVTAATAGNPRQYIVIGEGILRITTEGTIIPSYSFSGTLTSGVTSLSADNYLIIQSLDTSDSSTYTGSWS